MDLRFIFNLIHFCPIQAAGEIVFRFFIAIVGVFCLPPLLATKNIDNVWVSVANLMFNCFHYWLYQQELLAPQQWDLFMNFEGLFMGTNIISDYFLHYLAFIFHYKR
jgi:hypothetical protein